MRRFLPVSSTTRWIVGTSRDVDQFSGTGSRSDHVLPASRLRFITIAPLPCPLGYVARIVLLSSKRTVVTCPRYWPLLTIDDDLSIGFRGKVNNGNLEIHRCRKRRNAYRQK